MNENKYYNGNFYHMNSGMTTVSGSRRGGVLGGGFCKICLGGGFGGVNIASFFKK